MTKQATATAASRVKGQRKRWTVTGTVIAGTCLGEFEADTAEEAIALALPEASVSVCHQCAHVISDPEVDEASLCAEEL